MKYNKVIYIYTAVMLISQLYGKNSVMNYRPEFNTPMLLTKTVTDTDTTVAENNFYSYPARGLLMSLAIPGSGQWYAGAKLKSLLFVGVEISAWLTWRNMTNKGADQRIKFENYADVHWSLRDWVQNTIRPELAEYGDVRIIGTHHFNVQWGSNGSIVNSAIFDSLGWPGSDVVDTVIAIKDRDFYENIGKYDQFVGGWDDVFDEFGNPNWWEKKKNVEGDSVELLIMTENRKTYLNKRDDHNKSLQVASYTTAAIMFNHVISALDAVWESKKRSRKSRKVDTSVGLLYSPVNRYGIGGVRISLNW